MTTQTASPMTVPAVLPILPTAEMPLQPLDRSASWLVRLLFWSARRRYGAVPMAFRVLYTRAPFIAVTSLFLLTALSRWVSLPRGIVHLVQVAVAMHHGCSFCADIGLAEALRANMGAERFAHLSDSDGSPHFDDREQAALAYAAALGASRRVPREVFDRLGRLFSERELVEIVWLGAVESYFNAMAVPLGLESDGLAENVHRV